MEFLDGINKINGIGGRGTDLDRRNMRNRKEDRDSHRKT